MFRATSNRAALSGVFFRPIANKSTVPRTSHVRLNRIPLPTRRNFYTRQVHGSNTQKRPGTLIATTGLTLVAALAVSPLGTNMPRELYEEVDKAWDRAFASDSIAAAREASLLETRF
ncbi:hypothetical protein PG994_009332 [Apiospora phragmitis]|uniref:Uncharacterized protein n=1 Tax=Apiospora phragmitis TaxID=2905665 RepID=A0ABR1UJ10_9PEZI